MQEIIVLSGCIDNNIYFVDISSISSYEIGQTFSFSSSTTSEQNCGVIISTRTVVSSTDLYLMSAHTDCFDCLSGLGVNSLVFSGCSLAPVITISLQGFIDSNFLPTLNYTYYIKAGSSYNECMTFSGTSSDPGGYTLNSYNLEPFESCESCNNRERVVEVTACDGNFGVYILVPSGVTVGDLILFSFSFPTYQGFDYFCGIVGTEVIGEPSAFFVANYGKEDCIFCSTEGDNPSGFIRRKLYSCLDNNNYIVVDVSSTYNDNQSTFLTIDDGTINLSSCYRIGEITEEPLDTYAQVPYRPIGGCQECIDCRGAFLQYSACTDGGTGYTFTNQYIQIGEFYKDPITGCTQVIGYTENLSIQTPTTIGRTKTFTACTDCDSYVPNLWTVENCGLIGDLYIVDMNEFPLSETNQTYKYETVNGSSPICFTLLNNYTGPYSAITNLHYLVSGASQYTTCNDCLTTTQYSISIVECGSNTIENVNIVGLNLAEILQLIELYNTITIKDVIGNCYQLFGELCISNNQYPLFQPYSLHADCVSCNQPFSAGTPTKICVLCCPCSTGDTMSSVYGPHPTWSNQQGKAIVLLDAIVLGGPNGVNA